MKIVADRVHPDEPCYGLYQGPRDGRWITAVYVVRDDAIAEYTEDHGPEALFARSQPMAMPSPDGCNPVGELMGYAEKNRHDTFWADRVDEMLAESTLIQDHIRQHEQNRKLIRNQSMFGPNVTAQRNGYPRKAARDAKRP